MKSSNIFESQRSINQQTHRLYLMFFIAIFCVLFIFNIIIAQIDISTHPLPAQPEYYPQNYNLFGLHIYRYTNFHWISNASLLFSLAVLLIIVFNYFNVKLSLKSGADIARIMMATEVTGNRSTQNVRQLNNIVEEIAIASGIIAPRVFVVSQDTSINAFAAGFSSTDAIIAVTEGALTGLSRAEMQALIAHEMGHIVSQDMRINMELSAILSGLMGLTVIGWALFRIAFRTSSTRNYMRRSNNSKGQAGIIFGIICIGLILIIAGGLSYFIGRIIQSKISKKREFFADSHSVRTLREAQPMVDLLRKIQVAAADATQNARQNPQNSTQNNALYSHFMFTNRFTTLFSTHPSLDDRIKAISNIASGTVNIGNSATKIRVNPSQTNAASQISIDIPLQVQAMASSALSASAMPVANAHAFADNTSQTNTNQVFRYELDAQNLMTDIEINDALILLNNFPEPLKVILNDPSQVAFVYYALCLVNHAEIRQQQLSLFEINEQITLLKCDELIRKMRSSDTKTHYYVIAELAFRTLHQLSSQTRHALINRIDCMNELGKINIRQYCLSYSLKYLSDNIDEPKSAYYLDQGTQTLSQFKIQVQYLLSVVSQTGGYKDIAITTRYFQNSMNELYPNFRETMNTITTDWPTQLTYCLNELTQLRTNHKKLLINAILKLIQADQVITDAEYETTRLISLCLSYPLPLVFTTQDN